MDVLISPYSTSASARTFFHGCGPVAYKQLDSKAAKRDLKSWPMGHGVAVERHIRGCIALSKALMYRSIFWERIFRRLFGRDFLSLLRSSDS